MFDGLAAHFFKDNKVADDKTLVLPKEYSKRLKIELQSSDGTGDYEMMPNVTFKAELKDYKRKRIMADA